MADDAWTLLEGRVTQALTTADEVIGTLPAGSPPAWRDIAYKEMIGAVLRDWTANGTKELVDEDTSNLTGFLRVAVSAAGRAKPELTDAAFQVVLRGLLDDWVANWGGDGESDEG
ncbi:MAG: hypothetical protein LBJ87_11160 [bacterium]|jgi:hypothetical protein|nr:hypothetical protein [bacterium]